MTRLTIAERTELGRAARSRTPRSAHADLILASDRRDPVELLTEQNETRVPWLVPVRHGRMSASPFTFYRGTARIMAADLAATPSSGLDVQLVGDAHLSNFGAYASPERQLVFDVNDFDETLHGPFEWDVKRLAASFAVASRHLGFSREVQTRIVARSVETYRASMRSFAETGFLDLWYQYSTPRDLWKLRDTADEDKIEAFERRARSRNSLHALKKLTHEIDGRFRIKTNRPVLVPISELLPEFGPEELEAGVTEAFERYLASLRDDRRFLLERYELVDIALKVVGVGSVGTRCFVLLLEGRDEHDPLFLQAKEANASVLEEYLHTTRYPHHGERVVAGQRQIQAQSDIFLGWTTGRQGIHYYMRQLRDWKRSYDVESATPDDLEFYAAACGHILARGHARSGDAVAISAYVGESRKFDNAIVAFAHAYAKQTASDYETFMTAIDAGRIDADLDLT